VRVQVTSPAEHAALLDFPLGDPLATWSDPRVKIGTDGAHRHVVRYLELADRLYVVKELPDALAEREHTLLRRLADASIPAVEPVAFVTGRGAAAADEGLLVTRHLDFSLPYRRLFSGRVGIPQLREQLIDALVGLLVRAHLVGFFWGDCSLGNTLFRRDAGRLSAYVVDVETGEAHDQLSDGQRAFDLSIAEENILGGIMDLQAAGKLPPEVDAVATAASLVERYERLWAEITSTETFAVDERWRVAQRIARVNDLGFDVVELTVTSDDSGTRLRLTPCVVENGFHGPRLAALTGLHAGENQARRLLNDIAQFGAFQPRPLPEAIVAARWLEQAFEPVVAAVPPQLADRLEPVELYHQVLEHRWFRSEQRGFDVGLDAAMWSYFREVLPYVTGGRVVHDLPTTQVPVVAPE
jgi:hypothetical protein